MSGTQVAPLKFLLKWSLAQEEVQELHGTVCVTLLVVNVINLPLRLDIPLCFIPSRVMELLPYHMARNFGRKNI